MTISVIVCYARWHASFGYRQSVYETLRTPGEYKVVARGIDRPIETLAVLTIIRKPRVVRRRQTAP